MQEKTYSYLETLEGPMGEIHTQIHQLTIPHTTSQRITDLLELSENGLQAAEILAQLMNEGTDYDTYTVQQFEEEILEELKIIGHLNRTEHLTWVNP